MRTLRGRCLCGDLSYDLDGPLLSMAHCHCSMCRKHHGTAFQTDAAARRESFHWRTGLDGLSSYRSSSDYERAFCGRCGSTMPAGGTTGELIFIPVGNLEGDPGKNPEVHIFVGSKATWYAIADDLPQHEFYPPGYDAPVIDRPEPHGESGTRKGTCKGSCLCGTVRFQFNGSPTAMRNCHCSRCRLARAAAHATNVFCPADAFEWLAGEDEIQSFDLPGAERFGTSFCGICGSCLPRLSSVAGWNIPAGSLDDDPGMVAQLHIFAGSRAPWFEIRDALPQHEEY